MLLHSMDAMVLLWKRIMTQKKALLALQMSVEGRRKLECTQELDYLSHIVFRIFEITGRDVEDPGRFRVEVLFSEGAHGDPIKVSLYEV